MAGKFAEKAALIFGKAKEKAAELKEESGPMLEKAKEKAAELKEKAEPKLAEAREKSGGFLKDASTKISGGAKDLAENFKGQKDTAPAAESESPVPATDEVAGAETGAGTVEAAVNEGEPPRDDDA